MVSGAQEDCSCSDLKCVQPLLPLDVSLPGAAPPPPPVLRGAAGAPRVRRPEVRRASAKELHGVRAGDGAVGGGESLCKNLLFRAAKYVPTYTPAYMTFVTVRPGTVTHTKPL